MIEVFGTTAARIALARQMLGCPGCGRPLRPWGHARERTVRDTGGTLLAILCRSITRLGVSPALFASMTTAEVVGLPVGAEYSSVLVRAADEILGTHR
jgi:hypothetical protein